MQQQYGMLGDLADDEYSKYRDAYNQWLTERDYAQGNADTAYDRGYNQWLQQWNQFNTDRNYQLEKENADRQYQLQLEQFRRLRRQRAAAEEVPAAVPAAARTRGVLPTRTPPRTAGRWPMPRRGRSPAAQRIC